MIKNTLYFLIFLFMLTFFYYISFIYFSAYNKKKIFQNRDSVNQNQLKNFNSLKILKSDTDNIIEYNFESNKREKRKERKFWNIIEKK